MKALEAIAKRREILLAESEGQRQEIARFYRQLQKPARLAQSVTGIFKSPLMLTLGAALLMKTPWRRFAKIPMLLWKGFQIFRVFKAGRKMM